MISLRDWIFSELFSFYCSTMSSWLMYFNRFPASVLFFFGFHLKWSTLLSDYIWDSNIIDFLSSWFSSFEWIMMENINSLPSPNTEFTFIWPPNISTIFLEILKPSPQPFGFSFAPFSSSMYPKFWNSELSFSSLIPRPVSLTIVFKYRLFPSLLPSRSSRVISKMI